MIHDSVSNFSLSEACGADDSTIRHQSQGEINRQIFRELHNLRETVHEVMYEQRVLSTRLVDTSSRLVETNHKIECTQRAYQDLLHKVNVLPGVEVTKKEYEKMRPDRHARFPDFPQQTADVRKQVPDAPIISLENALSLGGSTRPKPQPEAFIMVLCKADASGCPHIGAEFRPSGDGRLIVKKISDSGLVSLYNQKAAADKKLVVGDTILDVNGKTDSKTMMRECQNKKLLRMSVIHAKEEVYETIFPAGQQQEAYPAVLTHGLSSYQDFSVAQNHLYSSVHPQAQTHFSSLPPHTASSTTIPPVRHGSMGSIMSQGVVGSSNGHGLTSSGSVHSSGGVTYSTMTTTAADFDGSSNHHPLSSFDTAHPHASGFVGGGKTGFLLEGSTSNLSGSVASASPQCGSSLEKTAAVLNWASTPTVTEKNTIVQNGNGNTPASEWANGASWCPIAQMDHFGDKLHVVQQSREENNVMRVSDLESSRSEQKHQSCAGNTGMDLEAMERHREFKAALDAYYYTKDECVMELPVHTIRLSEELPSRTPAIQRRSEEHGEEDEGEEQDNEALAVHTV